MQNWAFMRQITGVILAVCMFFWVYGFGLAGKLVRLKRTTLFHTRKTMKQTRVSWLSYERMERFLLSHGAGYLFQGRLTPEVFLGWKLGAGMLLGLALGSVLPGLAAAGLFVGFFLPDWMLRLSNEADNEKILPDMKNVYDTLRIQTKAGVFLTYSLSECYLAAATPRLKAALLELNNKIIAKSDLDSAMDEFQMQFDNEFINTFCMIIKQSMESGRSVQILTDLSSQMEEVERALSIKRKEALDRRIQILQMLLFAGLLGVCIYGLGVEIMKNMTSF